MGLVWDGIRWGSSVYERLLSGKNPVAMRSARRAAGFSLVELAVTVAVLGLLMAIAMPSFQNMINHGRLTGATNELVGVLQAARMESVRRNQRVALCPSVDGAACAGVDWSRLIIFADADRDGAPEDASDVLRDVQVASGNGISIHPSGNVTSNQRIGFGADGFVRVGAANATEGALSICSGKLPATGNTRDVTVRVSRIAVQSRGSAACAGLAN